MLHPGWRATLERAWQPGAGQATYRYTWSFNPDGSEGVVFWYEKAHARYGYQWIHPVHEVLKWVGEGVPGPTVTVEGMQLDHHPDPTKSRGQYLPLLELSVEEEHIDDGFSSVCQPFSRQAFRGYEAKACAGLRSDP